MLLRKLVFISIEKVYKYWGDGAYFSPLAIPTFALFHGIIMCTRAIPSSFYLNMDKNQLGMRPKYA
jgi:hypothetical protein